MSLLDAAVKFDHALLDAAMDAPEFESPEEEAAYVEQMGATLDAFRAEPASLATYIHGVIRREELEAKRHDAEIEWLDEMRDQKVAARNRHGNHAKRLKKYLVYTLEQMPNAGHTITADAYVFSLKKNPHALLLSAPEKIPESFTKTVIEIDKAAVKDALKAGEIVPGASLTQCHSLTVKAR